MSLRTIIMTKGIPGSGKTTWVLKEMQRNPGKYKRINKDIMREMLDTGIFTPQNESFIVRARNYMVEMALLKGSDVIIDDTNFSDKHWELMCAIGRRVGNVRIFEKFFDTTLKTALAQNQMRSNPIPEHAVRSMYEKHVKNKAVLVRDEYFPPERISKPAYDQNKEDAIIVDIDGTLALTDGKRDYYDFSMVGEDNVNGPIVTIVGMFYDVNMKLLIVSGRDDSCYDDTAEWLRKKCLFQHFELFMRKTGDHRPDVIVKREIYEEKIAPRYNIDYVFDDRPCMCELFRSLGLVVLQVENKPF